MALLSTAAMAQTLRASKAVVGGQGDKGECGVQEGEMRGYKRASSIKEILPGALGIVYRRSRRGLFFLSLMPVVFLSVSCSRKPAEETVTVRSPRQSTGSSVAPRVSTSPLPVRNSDVEKAGDLIAEATLSLRQRNSIAALHSASLAETEIKRALDETGQNATTHAELVSTLDDLETARAAIRRGMFDDAIRRLGELNKKLDSIN